MERLHIPLELFNTATHNITAFDGTTVECKNSAYVPFQVHELTFIAYAGVLDHLPSGLDIVLGQDVMRFKILPSFSPLSQSITNAIPNWFGGL